MYASLPVSKPYYHTLMALSVPSTATLLVILSQLFMQILVANAKVSSIIVFGDSSVDSGNNDYIQTTLRSNFRPYGRDFQGGKATGRFSNGRLPTDFISEAYGLKKTVPAYLDPSYTIEDFATGVCFASAGTGYDNLTSRVFNVMPLWKELEYYKEYQSRLRDHLGSPKADEVIREALYIISIGTNDFLENYYLLPHRPRQYSVEDFQKFLIRIARTFIARIYELGARKVSLTGLPPMGCLPLERATNFADKGECNDKYNDVALNFNKKLRVLVRAINKDLSGIRVVFTDPYPILDEIIRNPRSFGFENEAVACCGTGTFETGYLCNEHDLFTCSDADKYVFWDSIHPSDKTNGLVAYYAVRTSLSVFL